LPETHGLTVLVQAYHVSGLQAIPEPDGKKGTGLRRWNDL
jgi:hypothetical protein